MLLLSLFFMHPASAQSADEYHVRWIGSYPGKKGEQTANFGQRVSRIIFGQKAQEVVKPFNVVASNQEQFWILDQGAGAVFEVDKGKGALLRSMKRAGQEYPSLVGICRMSGGDLLFTDSRLDRVVRIAGDHLLNFGDSVVLCWNCDNDCRYIMVVCPYISRTFSWSQTQVAAISNFIFRCKGMWYR